MTSSVSTLRQSLSLSQERRPYLAHSNPSFKAPDREQINQRRAEGPGSKVILFGPFRLLDFPGTCKTEVFPCPRKTQRLQAGRAMAITRR